jgi:hypothetical protein
MDDKLALRVSQAGMRLIAQMTIYNSGNFERLRQFVGESYDEDALAQQSVEARVEEFRQRYELLGKLRVQQVIGTGKHHVIVLLRAQNDDEFYLNQLKVDEEYPHLIIEYQHDLMV